MKRDSALVCGRFGRNTGEQEESVGVHSRNVTGAEEGGAEC